VTGNMAQGNVDL